MGRAPTSTWEYEDCFGDEEQDMDSLDFNLFRPTGSTTASVRRLEVVNVCRIYGVIWVAAIVLVVILIDGIQVIFGGAKENII